MNSGEEPSAGLSPNASLSPDITSYNSLDVSTEPSDSSSQKSSLEAPQDIDSTASSRKSSSGGSFDSSRRKSTKEKVSAAFTSIMLTSSMSLQAKKSKSASSRVQGAELTSQALTHRLYNYTSNSLPSRTRKLTPIIGVPGQLASPPKLTPQKQPKTVLRARNPDAGSAVAVEKAEQVSLMAQSKLSHSTAPQKRLSSDNLSSNNAAPLDSGARFVGQSVVPPIQSEQQPSANKKARFTSQDKDEVMDIAPSAEPIKKQNQLVAIKTGYVPRPLNAQNPFEFINYLKANPSVKEFAYGVPKSRGVALESFNPYDLKLVEYGDIEKKYGYFTISRNVRVCV